MSLLLDALKQSQNQSSALESEPDTSQQEALDFYRRLSWGLVALVVIAVVLVVGYFAGKWWQDNSNELLVQAKAQMQAQMQAQEQQSTKVNVTATQTASPAQVNAELATNQAQPVNNPQNQVTGQQVGQSVAQGLPQGQVNLNALQVPVQFAQPYQQMVPVYVMGQMPQAYGPGTYMQWVPAYGNPMMANAGQYPQTFNPGAQPVDSSQYKVVGKPMEQGNNAYQQPQQGYSSTPSYNDAELQGVSSDLKRAFADAVAATAGMQNDDSVTTASRSSAMVEPIELLPEAIQSRIPSLVYQAHIYATAQDRRWIKLNGYELYEGDNVGRIRVVEITPEQTILSIDNYEFSLEAMQDWP
ncbi:general secretion pathway protein GspB [Pseudoalteromonas sp. T1lg10]|uniref:general secretion pathway protein GspB n=1 Tax=Pseudoalteromonas sp. T1lg10 TaxID=2077093 RepID=UPI000CF64F75|nr:general secretion pathway protein GspB [Pseudoalteromonas sp. T1lg10]